MTEPESTIIRATSDDDVVHPAVFPAPPEKYSLVTPSELVKGLIPYRRVVAHRTVTLRAESVQWALRRWQAALDRLDDSAWNVGQSIKQRGGAYSAACFLLPDEAAGWTSVAAAKSASVASPSEAAPDSRREAVRAWFTETVKRNAVSAAAKDARTASQTLLEMQPFLEFCAAFSVTGSTAGTISHDVLMLSLGGTSKALPSVRAGTNVVVTEELRSLAPGAEEQHHLGLHALEELLESAAPNDPGRRGELLSELEAAMNWHSSPDPNDDDAVIDQMRQLARVTRVLLDAQQLPGFERHMSTFIDAESKCLRLAALQEAIGAVAVLQQGTSPKPDYRSKGMLSWALKAMSILTTAERRDRRQLCNMYQSSMRVIRVVVKAALTPILLPLRDVHRVDLIHSEATSVDAPAEILVFAYCRQLLTDWAAEPEYAALDDVPKAPPVDLNALVLHVCGPVTLLSALFFLGGVALAGEVDRAPLLPPVDLDPGVPKRRLPTTSGVHEGGEGSPLSALAAMISSRDVLQSAIRRVQRSFLSDAAPIVE